MEIFKPQFRHIVKGLAGAEGPVFNKEGSKFYMVAPEVEVNGKPAGQIISVDIETNVVRLCIYIFIHLHVLF